MSVKMGLSACGHHKDRMDSVYLCTQCDDEKDAALAAEKRAREDAERSLEMLHGKKFSDRNYHALLSRAEDAESYVAEVAQGITHYPHGSGGRCCVRCDLDDLRIRHAEAVKALERSELALASVMRTKKSEDHHEETS